MCWYSPFVRTFFHVMNFLRYESMWHIDVVCSQRGTYIHCNRWLEHLMYDLCSGRLRTETTIQLQSKKCEEANKALHLFVFTIFY